LDAFARVTGESERAMEGGSETDGGAGGWTPDGTRWRREFTGLPSRWAAGISRSSRVCQAPKEGLEKRDGLGLGKGREGGAHS
jgi:hypothetical protein